MGLAQLVGLAPASLATLSMAEDLLFYNNLLYQEYTQATTVLGFTGTITTHQSLKGHTDVLSTIAKVVTPEEWNSYTTADFANYKAIIIPDPDCGSVDDIAFLDATKSVWSPAILGSMILIGTDPGYHSSSRPGAITLMDDGIKFAASGNGTGLYFALSCYYDAVDSATVDSLSEFGTITVRGNLACYNDAHVVANSSALGSLDDAALSDWSCSVHEVFTSYPTTGLYGFEPLAIAEGATGDGLKDFADGTSGIPYIIVKGATPAGCGDGVWDPSLDEECDEGALNGTPGSNCSSSCKCLTGSITPGVCANKVDNSTSSLSSTARTSSRYLIPLTRRSEYRTKNSYNSALLTLCRPQLPLISTLGESNSKASRQHTISTDLLSTPFTYLTTSSSAPYPASNIR